MDKYELQRLRELPIEAVAERLGLRVQKHKALCPFHPDSHPSLSFNVKKNTFRCFVCSAHGGVIDLAMHMLQKPFRETCEWLANEHNVILTEWQPAVKQHKEYPLDVEYLEGLVARPVLHDAARRFLFDERRLDPRVVQWLGISSIELPTPCWRYGRPYYDAPSLLIPYRDIDGRLLNVQSRYLGSEKEKPRFRFPRGSTCHIFNLPILKMLRDGEDLWIAEGSTDCMALLSSGKKAIAIPSATLLNHDDMHLFSSSISPTSHLHIYPDQDQAGENLYTALLQVATDLKRCLVRHDLPKGCKDFGDFWKYNSTTQCK